jgi:hypothetical protein
MSNLLLIIALCELAMLPIYLLNGVSKNSPWYIFLIVGALLGGKVWYWAGSSDPFKTRRLFGLD